MTSEPGNRADGLTAEDFQELAADHGPALYRFARSLGAGPAAAEDLVQDTFVRAFQRRDQYGGGNIGAWLRRILHNIAVDGSRAASRREIPVEVVEERWSEDSYTVDATVVVERAELRAELEDALRGEGWDVVESGPVNAFLGWQIRATSDRMVANVWLGDVEPGRGRTSAYAPLEGAVHTQLSVGRRDANWAWTQIED
ncbi:MAG: RNA polymerase sigma factor [Actinobacteria bacterium]|nr:RNA polymerase sigma factor [Actinomycetota bacterium]